jgi:glutaredoxin-dependent peroxiredoxin
LGLKKLSENNSKFILCAMKIEIGMQAPEFSLYDSDKKKISLSDQRGHNVLLLFYPVAFTGTCTKELCAVRDTISGYNDVDAKVLAISVDTVYSLAKYKEEQNLNFPLLSDFNKEVSTAYGSLYEKFNYDMRGVSKRSAFVIDRSGIVRYAEVLENASLVPDFEAIQKTLSKLESAEPNS